MNIKTPKLCLKTIFHDYKLRHNLHKSDLFNKVISSNMYKYMMIFQMKKGKRVSAPTTVEV